MKFVRNETVYDTETAEKIFVSKKPMYFGSSFDVEQTLYRTKNGILFVHKREIRRFRQKLHKENIKILVRRRKPDTLDTTVSEWLEEQNAGVEVYEELGIKLAKA